MAERNTFGFTYSISPYIYSDNYTVAIIAHQSDSVRIGTELNFDLDYWVDPDQIPIGSNPTTTIEWINYEGDILGDQESISYTPVIPGWYSIQVEVILEDVAFDFYLRFSEGYTFYIEALQPSDNSFKLSYNNNHGTTVYSNMDTYRFLTYFPSWSSSHINFYSKSSKYISPQLERIAHILDNLDTIVTNNKSNKKVFEYQEEWFKILTIEIPDYIHTEYGYCVNLGDITTASLSGTPISAISKDPTYNINKIRLESLAGFDRIRLPIPSTVYIRSKNALLHEHKFIIINGIDRYGKFITEKIILNSSVAVETINEYLVINRIERSEMDVSISNYLKEDISFNSDNSLLKRIVSRSGIYFIPEFEVYNETLLVKNADRVSRNEEFKFNLPFEPDEILITNLLDVILLKNNILYAAKLMLDYYQLSPPGSSVNHNSFIFVDDENAEVGSTVAVTINTSLLKSESAAEDIKISIMNRDIRLYLHPSGSLVPESDTWIKLNTTGNHITMSINVDNDDPYIFELKDASRTLPYHAMVYQNKIVPIKISEEVGDVYFHNKNIHIEDLASNSYMISPVRLGFVTDDRYSYLQYDFEKMELIYED